MMDSAAQLAAFGRPPSTFRGMKILIQDDRVTYSSFKERLLDVAHGERKPYMPQRITKGPVNGEVWVNQLGGKMIMNSRTHNEFLARTGRIDI